MPRERMVPIDKLRVTFFVRRSLDHDRVNQFVELYRASAALPPLEISSAKEIIDGRHRLEALKILGRKEATCVVTETESLAATIAHALAVNMGGALSPTTDDIRFTIKQLLEAGANRKAIAGMLTFLPASVTRRYVDDVQSNMAKARLTKAVAAIADDDLSVRDAAERFDVDLAALQAAIRGSKKKVKKDAATLNGIVGSRYRGLSTSNAKFFTRILKELEDGEVTAATVRSVFQHIERSHKRAAGVIADYKRRFETNGS